MVRILRMYFHLFLVAPVSCCSVTSVGHGPSETVWASAGGDATLPCSFNGDDFPTVEWSKRGLQPRIVFLYRDGCETHEMKDAAFEYRTSFIMKELQNRNISLRISNVQLSDAGKYQCKRLWKNARWNITTVQLVVGAVSEPKLSVVSAEGGRVTLQCVANCWLPEPEITFLDNHEKEIPADDPRRHQGTSGCYTVTRKVTLQDAANSVTCRVHEPKTNQTRNTEILVAVDCMRSCFLPTPITVGVTLVILVTFVLVFFYMQHRKPVTKECHTTENNPTLGGNDEPNPQGTTHELMADSTSQLRESICQASKLKIDEPKSGNSHKYKAPKIHSPRRHSCSASFRFTRNSRGREESEQLMSTVPNIN